jgi:hypothetical protein
MAIGAEGVVWTAIGKLSGSSRDGSFRQSGGGIGRLPA